MKKRDNKFNLASDLSSLKEDDINKFLAKIEE
jgi:hypothetical protein